MSIIRVMNISVFIQKKTNKEIEVREGVVVGTRNTRIEDWRLPTAYDSFPCQRQCWAYINLKKAERKHVSLLWAAKQ